MRIISGTAGGRRLKRPKGDATRPTSDRVREAIFSMLGPPDTERRCLDLFAGSGALGLEALSRGIAEAVFVDSSRIASRCIQENLATLNWAQRAVVQNAGALAAVRELSSKGERFSWIFADPPYDSDLAERTLALVAENQLLENRGYLVIEHDKRHPMPLASGSLRRSHSKRYGDTDISIYRREVTEYES